jgi:hypothetical protein
MGVRATGFGIPQNVGLRFIGFQNWALKRIFGLKKNEIGEEVAGNCIMRSFLNVLLAKYN